MAISGATVEIYEGYDPATDMLECTACRGDAGVLASDWNRATGMLVLKGYRSLREVIDAVASVQLRGSALATGTKKIRYRLATTHLGAEAPGRYYRVVDNGEMCSWSGGCTWARAQEVCAAEENDLFGLVGYLPTPVVSQEMAVLTYMREEYPGTTFFLGCTDTRMESTFTWLTGPQGCPPYTATTGSERSACADGVDVVGTAVPTDPWFWADKYPVSVPGSALMEEHDWCMLGQSIGTSGFAGVEDTIRSVSDGKRQTLCEYGGVGALCIPKALVTDTVELAPLNVDECAEAVTEAKGLEDTFFEPGASTKLFADDNPAAEPCQSDDFSDPACDCETEIQGATVTIATGYADGDTLACPRCAAHGLLLAPPNEGNMGTVTRVFWEITRNGGDGELEDVLDALHGLTFTPSATAPHTTRLVIWNLELRWYSFATDRYYAFSSRRQNWSWELAQAYCAGFELSALGLIGYLATITSKEEADATTFTYRDLPLHIWLGATDLGEEGNWRWVTGPEASTVCAYNRDATATALRSGCNIYPISDQDVCSTKECQDSLTLGDNTIGRGSAAQGSATPWATIGYSKFSFDEPDDDVDVGYWQGNPTPVPRADFAAIEISTGSWVDLFSADQNTMSPMDMAALCEFGGVGSLCIRDDKARGRIFLRSTAFTCSTCAPCTQGQLCTDGDPSRPGTKDCTSLSNECDTLSTTCSDQGQDCVDEDLLNDGTWQCVCPAPQTGSQMMGVATCELDECEYDGACKGAQCMKLTARCGADQICYDDYLTSLDDWECWCMSPSMGMQKTGLATCTLDECEARECPVGQNCVDPDVDTSGDFECSCQAPATGDAVVGAAATCLLDECVPSALCATCIAAAGCGTAQTCKDPDTDSASTRDWACTCDAPLVGRATASPAVCGPGDDCTKTGKAVCGAAAPSQTCFDPDAATPDDWECRCDLPLVGSNKGGVATCRLDECASTGDSVCGAAGQTCVDPSMSPGDTGDWECWCDAPQTGTRVAGVASCELDECLAVPCGRGQTCVDPMLRTLDDYECECVAPHMGLSIGGSAVCALNECQARPLVCGDRQDCSDLDFTTDGDFRCTCQAPAIGEQQGSPAACQLDECVPSALCATCIAAAGCGTAQTCKDPDTDSASTRDWACTCDAPLVGRATASPAVCGPGDDCTKTGKAVCGAAAPSQTCFDPDAATPDDWECRCDLPLVGSNKGGVATCRLDECASTGDSVCGAAGQTCVDPSMSPGDTGDWECWCDAPQTGTRVGGAAGCKPGEPSVAPLTQMSMLPSTPPPTLEVTAIPVAGTPKPPQARAVPSTVVPAVVNNTDGAGGGGGGNASNAPEVSGPSGFVVDEQDELKRVATPGVAVGAFGMSGASSAGKIAIIRSISCEVDDVDIAYETELDWEFHPTQVPLGSGKGRHLLGAVVINAALLAGFLVLTSAAATAVGACTRRSHADVLGIMRVPGVAYIPYLFLLQGTTLCSMRMLTSSEAGWLEIVVGACGMGASVGVAAWLTVCVLWRVNDLATAVPDPRVFEQHLSDEDRARGVTALRGWRRTLYVLLFGKTIWVPNEDDGFCGRYGAVFEGFRSGCAWWASMEILCIFAVTFVGSWRPTSMTICNCRNTLLCWALCSFFFGLVYLRPYSAAVDNAVAGFLAFLFAAAVTLMSIGIGYGVEPSSWFYRCAWWMLVVSSYTVALKAIWDLLLYALELYVARKVIVRGAAGHMRRLSGASGCSVVAGAKGRGRAFKGIASPMLAGFTEMESSPTAQDLRALHEELLLTPPTVGKVNPPAAADVSFADSSILPSALRRCTADPLAYTITSPVMSHGDSMNSSPPVPKSDPSPPASTSASTPASSTGTTTATANPLTAPPVRHQQPSLLSAVPSCPSTPQPDDPFPMATVSDLTATTPVVGPSFRSPPVPPLGVVATPPRGRRRNSLADAADGSAARMSSDVSADPHADPPQANLSVSRRRKSFGASGPLHPLIVSPSVRQLALHLKSPSTTRRQTLRCHAPGGEFSPASAQRLLTSPSSRADSPNGESALSNSPPQSLKSPNMQAMRQRHSEVLAQTESAAAGKQSFQQLRSPKVTRAGDEGAGPADVSAVLRTLRVDSVSTAAITPDASMTVSPAWSVAELPQAATAARRITGGTAGLASPEGCGHMRLLVPAVGMASVLSPSGHAPASRSLSDMRGGGTNALRKVRTVSTIALDASHTPVAQPADPLTTPRPPTLATQLTSECAATPLPRTVASLATFTSMSPL